MTAPHGRLRYQARCADCAWAGRQFVHYGTAEGSARDHAGAHAHTTYVVDQYDLRIAGSTVHPPERRQAL